MADGQPMGPPTLTWRRIVFYFLLFLVTLGSGALALKLIDVAGYQRQVLEGFAAKGAPSAGFIHRRLTRIEATQKLIEENRTAVEKADRDLIVQDKKVTDAEISQTDAKSDFKSALEKRYRFLDKNERAVWKTDLTYESLTLNRLLVLQAECGKRDSCAVADDMDRKWEPLRLAQRNLDKLKKAQQGAQHTLDLLKRTGQELQAQLEKDSEDASVEKSAIVEAGAKQFDCKGMPFCVDAATPYGTVIICLAATTGLFGGCITVLWRLITITSMTSAWSSAVLLASAMIAGLLAYFIVFVGGALIGLSRLDGEGVADPQLVVALSALAGMGAESTIPALLKGWDTLLIRAKLKERTRPRRAK